MARIFISYRRADSQAITGRIYDRLVARFGEDNVFMDVDRVPAGSNFPELLDKELSQCDIMLVLIGRQWVTITDDDGNRRLDNPDDFVRLEVERGLGRKNMLFIPVLVDGAETPRPEDLPASLRDLLIRQNVTIRHNPDFHRDMDRLMEFLGVFQQRDERAQQQLQRILLIVGAAVGVLLVTVLGLAASGLVQIGPAPATSDPREVALQIVTLTAEAAEGLEGTRQIEIVLTGFVAETATSEFATQTAIVAAFTDTPTSTPTATSTPSPSATSTLTDTPQPPITPNQTATQAAISTQSARATLAVINTQNAEATNNALGTLRAPTNTPEPTETSTPTSTPTATNTATYTPTATLSPSFTPTATATPTVTAARTSTSTATIDMARSTAQQATALANAQATVAAQSSLTALPTRSSSAIIIVNNDINLREGPGTDTPVVAVVPSGSSLPIIGTSQSGNWLNVQLPDGTTGWISGTLAATSTPVFDPNRPSSIQNPVTANNQWTPVLEDFDGVTMVLVPVGCFSMGGNDGIGLELPVHRQCFDQPFWIDQTEVTQADFERIGGQKEDPNRFEGDQRPVEDINWFEARDFCLLRGMRLPTEREWEYVARGPDNLIYPWGNDWNPDNAAWGDNSNGQTAPVGSRPVGASWVSAQDMIGNVWEWVSSLYRAYPYVPDNEPEAPRYDYSNRVVRGGSFADRDTIAMLSYLRIPTLPDLFYRHVGVRCVRDYDTP